jgi:hypothetical protein
MQSIITSIIALSDHLYHALINAIDTQDAVARCYDAIWYYHAQVRIDNGHKTETFTREGDSVMREVVYNASIMGKASRKLAVTGHAQVLMDVSKLSFTHTYAREPQAHTSQVKVTIVYPAAKAEPTDLEVRLAYEEWMNIQGHLEPKEEAKAEADAEVVEDEHVVEDYWYLMEDYTKEDALHLERSTMGKDRKAWDRPNRVLEVAMEAQAKAREEEAEALYQREMAEAKALWEAKVELFKKVKGGMPKYPRTHYGKPMPRAYWKEVFGG